MTFNFQARQLKKKKEKCKVLLVTKIALSLSLGTNGHPEAQELRRCRFVADLAVCNGPGPWGRICRFSEIYLFLMAPGPREGHADSLRDLAVSNGPGPPCRRICGFFEI